MANSETVAKAVLYQDRVAYYREAGK